MSFQSKHTPSLLVILPMLFLGLGLSAGYNPSSSQTRSFTSPLQILMSKLFPRAPETSLNTRWANGQLDPIFYLRQDFTSLTPLPGSDKEMIIGPGIHFKAPGDVRLKSLQINLDKAGVVFSADTLTISGKITIVDINGKLEKEKDRSSILSQVFSHPETVQCREIVVQCNQTGSKRTFPGRNWSAIASNRSLKTASKPSYE